MLLSGILQLDALAGERSDAGRIGIAAPGIVGRDGVVVLLEVDDRDLEAVFACAQSAAVFSSVEPAATQIDAPSRSLGVLGRALADHEGLALVEIDALEIRPRGSRCVRG